MQHFIVFTKTNRSGEGGGKEGGGGRDKNI